MSREEYIDKKCRECAACHAFAEQREQCDRIRLMQEAWVNALISVDKGLDEYIETTARECVPYEFFSQHAITRHKNTEAFVSGFRSGMKYNITRVLEHLDNIIDMRIRKWYIKFADGTSKSLTLNESALSGKTIGEKKAEIKKLASFEFGKECVVARYYEDERDESRG